jgi:hypothetical protein
VVEVAVRWGCELECPEGNVAECLVLDTEGLIGGLDELMEGQGAVIGLTAVSDTFGGGTIELADNTIGRFLPQLFDSSVLRPDPVPPPSEWTNWKPCSASQDSASRNDVYQFLAFSVVAIHPVAASTRLPEEEVALTE